MVGFSPDEMERLKNNEEIDAKEVHLDNWTKEYIEAALKKLDEEGKLPLGYLSVYDKFVFYDPSDQLDPQDPEIAERLRGLRKGKETVALVGLASSSCGLAPFGDNDVQIWGANEAHAFKFFTEADAWFQVHNSYRQKIAKRGIHGHYDWLRENPWEIPIYSPHVLKGVPHSTAYPLDDVCYEFLGNIRKGDREIKYFNSSFDYMVALALLQRYERIEVYGFDMAGDNEYSLQKPSAEFWLGVAAGRGVEIYLPEQSKLLSGNLYGGAEQGEAWTQS
jgi:hypothetical protein